MELSHSKSFLYPYRLNLYSETNLVLKEKECKKCVPWVTENRIYTQTTSLFPFYFSPFLYKHKLPGVPMLEQKEVTCSVSDAFWNASPKIYFEESDL